MKTGISLNETRQALSATLIEQELSGNACSPIDISPWLAMSLMQKAIRRGHKEMALGAAATLLRDAPDRLWRRLCVTAFEDIGVADVGVVAKVVAALKGKHWRSKVGGEWEVASHLIRLMCEAPKCRGADDLLYVCEEHQDLNELRRDFAERSTAWLVERVLSDRPVGERALALWYAVGTNRCRSDRLAFRRSDFRAVLADLAGKGFSSTSIEIAIDGVTKCGEILPPFFMLLSAMSDGQASGITADDYPAESMIGPVPGWALDMHVREGNIAMRKFLTVECETTRWLAQYVPGAKRGKLLKHLVFRVESGLVDRRYRWETGDRFLANLLRVSGPASD